MIFRTWFALTFVTAFLLLLLPIPLGLSLDVVAKVIMGWAIVSLIFLIASLIRSIR